MSHWLISDDTHFVHSLDAIADVCRKNVLIWLSIFCCWLLITTNADTGLLAILGLPRINHCALNYNNALFILQGNDSNSSSLSLTFANDTFLPSSTQIPSIQWIRRHPNLTSSPWPSSSICTVTSYGQAIIFYPYFRQNVTIDLNTLNWTFTSPPRHRSLSSLPSPNLVAMATTIMDNDRILVLGKNSTVLSTWLLDASDSKLRWSWSELSNNSEFILPWSSGSATLVTTSSRIILYFSVDPLPSSAGLYNVSAYYFDMILLSWMGSLTNFTSNTNHVQAAMISNNINKNDTLLIVPDWIDTSINANFYKNVTSADLLHQQIQNQLHRQYHQQQQWSRHQQHRRQQQNNSANFAESSQNGNSASAPDSGFWILEIETQPFSSSSPATALTWHPSGTFNTVEGGSATRIKDKVIFYGGTSPTGSASAQANKRIFTGNNGTQYSLRFWDTTTQSYLATPAWLASLSPSATLSPPLTPPSIQSEQVGNSGTRTIVIVLATLLGVFGAAFFVTMVLLLLKRKKKGNNISDNTRSSHGQYEDQDASITAQRHDTPAILQNENATTWANQLQRSLSGILQHLRLSPSPAPLILPPLGLPVLSSPPLTQNKANDSPAEAKAISMSAPSESHRETIQEEVIGMNDSNRENGDTVNVIDRQQPQRVPSKSSDIENSDSMDQHRYQGDDMDTEQLTPGGQEQALPAIFPRASSNLNDSAPNSTRNSYLEGSLKASRFVEHF